MFDAILGHEAIKTYLKQALATHSLPQTLLFSGPDGIGKSLFANTLARLLLQTAREFPPDLHILSPEGKSNLYTVEALREMIDKEHAASFEGKGKVFILKDVERMQPAAANLLLKTLEEPSFETTFILLTCAQNEILPTILSRSVTLSFQALPEKIVSQVLKEKGHSPHFAKLAQGSLGRALELATTPLFEEQRKMVFQILAKKPFYPEMSLQLEQIEEELDKLKEDDPAKANQAAHHLFAYTLMWFRDQHLLSFSSSDFLFFPEEAPTQNPLPPLHEIEQKVEEARTAFQRNLKFSVCFKHILF